MSLTFPTLAEQALEAWRNAPRTIALSVVAKRHGADAQRLDTFDGTTWVYTFDDDTHLVVRGKGKNHKVVSHLP